MQFPFTGVFLFVCPKRNQKCPGGWLRGVQALQSPAPGPHTGGASRKAIPQRRRGWYSRLSLLPRRCRWLAMGRKLSGWTEKARRLPPAVGVGSGCGPVRTPAPIPIPRTARAGGYYPPLRISRHIFPAQSTEKPQAPYPEPGPKPAEAKRSFAESSFAYFSFKKSK